MYLLIYCEWLDSSLVRKACRKLVGKARLKDHKVAFSSFTEDGSAEMMYGGCHLEAAPGQTLYGVLYEISDDELKLDQLTKSNRAIY
jgi:hypothetical protein